MVGGLGSPAPRDQHPRSFRGLLINCPLPPPHPASFLGLHVRAMDIRVGNCFSHPVALPSPARGIIEPLSTSRRSISQLVSPPKTITRVLQFCLRKILICALVFFTLRWSPPHYCGRGPNVSSMNACTQDHKCIVVDFSFQRWHLAGRGLAQK